MFLIVLSLVAIVALAVLFKVEISNKNDILMALVLTLVVANYLNEVNNSLRYAHKFEDISHSKPISFSRDLYPNHNTKHTLLPEQNRVLEYLATRKASREYPMVHLKHLNFERFRLVFQELQKTNLDIVAAEVDANAPAPLSLYDLKQEISGNPQLYHCLVFPNIHTPSQLSLLKSLYLHNKIVIILLKVPSNFTLHTVSDLTEVLKVDQNYFSSVLSKTYPAALVALCRKHNNIDYDFFLRSHTVPLGDLCCKDLPHTPVTDCVREQMKHQEDFVPVQRVQHCFKKGGDEGLVYLNGLVKVDKGYFWAGKCQKTSFSTSMGGEL